MRYRLPVIIILILMFSGFGCSIKLGKKSNAKTYYVLQDSGSAKTTYRKRPLSLLLGETTAPALTSSRKIVFSRTPDTRSFYQYASWSETPPRFFTRLLLDRLETAGLFTAVCRRPAVVHTDLQLAVELIEFYHDASSQPGTARIKIRAQLFDNRKKATIDQRYFSRSVPVPTYDAKGAVQGFSQAVGLILDDVVDWLDKVTNTR
ncbi:MAG: ABC-type transport auxiliary lipoprotein family protein [Pseudomonadota bacterium]|nr:ABC-type transport auxiliary lipoprotein family protein [Pseudomonadota bacterium]